MIALGLFASLLMGLTLGLLGGGGSILTVPILIYLFGVDPLSATTASLLVVGSTALLAAAPYFKRREVSVEKGLQFSVSSFLGIYLARRYLLPSIPEVVVSTAALRITRGEVVLIAFSVLMVVVSIAMIRGRQTSRTEKSASFAKVLIQGVLVGALTGFVGAGGGFLIVPALVKLLKLPMRNAVGTSLLIIATNSFFGFAVSDLTATSIRWELLAGVIALAILGSFLGARLSTYVSEQKSKKAFGYFVLLSGCLILVDRLFNR